MIVVSHTSSHALLIFVAYLEKGKVLLGPKFLKCVCKHVGLILINALRFLQTKFENKIDM